MEVKTEVNEKALRENKVSIEQAFSHAFEHHQAGRLKEAETIYARILDAAPNHFDASRLLGTLYAQSERYELALDRLQKAALIEPNSASIRNNLANVFLALNRLHDSEQSYHKSLALQPNDAMTHNNLGVVLERLDQLEQSESCFRYALKLRPDYFEAHSNLGRLLNSLNQFEESEASYRQALALKPTNAGAHNNLGLALDDLNQLEAAETALRQALVLSPNYPEAHSNLGYLLKCTGRFREAEESYIRALEIRPDYAAAHFDLGFLLLLQEKYKRGWNEYEWRFKKETFTSCSFHSSKPWAGESLRGKILLLLSEQGLGDTIQALCYLSQLKTLGAELIVECQKPLQPLLSGQKEIQQLIIRGDALPAADFHIPLMSLPAILNENLTPSTKNFPYLRADINLITKWKQKLPASASFKIGINWQGNPSFKHDRWRSIPLEFFGALVSSNDVKLISLQKEQKGVEQIARFKQSHPLIDVDELSENDRDFMDTAAIIMNMDLIVTSCTSIAHLAGALGVPTWVVLGKNADWRWLLERDDSPWYPSIRLFRQKSRGEWGEVFSRVAREIQFLVGDEKPAKESF